MTEAGEVRCEVCGREKHTPGALQRIDLFCWKDALGYGGTAGDCYRLGYDRLRAGYAARGLTIDAYEKDIEGLVRELNALRDTYSEVLRSDVETTKQLAGARETMATAEKENGRLALELEAAQRGARTATENWVNAAEATQREIASSKDAYERGWQAAELEHDWDGDALEKALGALRPYLRHAHDCGSQVCGRGMEPPAQFGSCDCGLDAALSGGAHADGPKAQENEP